MRLDVIWKETPQFALGFGNTVWLCVVSMALSVGLAIVLVVLAVSRRPTVRVGSRLVIDGARCIPFLLLAYIVYFGLPTVGLRLAKWHAAILTLVVYNTAYTTEILRGAWAHLSPGQTEAGRAFGFRGIRLFRRVILPQVLIASGPTLGNQLIQLIKDSAFLSIITVPELTYAANSVQSFYFVPFESFLVATLLYWALCAAVERLVGQGERWSAMMRPHYARR